MDRCFSALYPNRLRSVVLDSAYPVIGETPWYFHAGEVVRQGYEDACKRAPACAALPGTSLDRIRKLVAYLVVHPIHGKAPDGEGHVHPVTVTPAMIGQMLFDGTNGPINHRELDAAARALFDNRDAAPLIRLTSENMANEYPQDLKSYSYGLFAAVSCIDYQDCVFRAEFDIVEEIAGIFDGLHCRFQYLIAAHIEFGFTMDRTGRQEDVQTATAGGFQRAGGRVNVCDGSAGEATDYRPIDLLRHGADGLFITGRGGGEAGLDDVDAHVAQRRCDAQFFGNTHAEARRLLAIAQRGVEDQNAVVIYCIAHDTTPSLGTVPFRRTP
ncbi:MAG: hypothetical protein WDM89_03030 [Rhizomicrobium sp.]